MKENSSQTPITIEKKPKNGYNIGNELTELDARKRR